MQHKWTKLKGNAIAECKNCNMLRSQTSYGSYYIDEDHNVESKAGECKGDK